MRALAIIAAEHRNMRLVAGALAVLGDRFAAGSADEAGLHTVELVVDYFEAYADHYHHARESDLLFARMRARSDRGAAMLDRLDRDHQEAHRDLARLRHLARNPNRHDAKNLTELAAEIARFHRLLDVHLRVEEEECFPLAGAVLTPADWAEIDAAFAAAAEASYVDAFAGCIGGAALALPSSMPAAMRLSRATSSPLIAGLRNENSGSSGWAALV